MNEIAYSVGFNNRQSFIKSFKIEMGKTPSQYKKFYTLRNGVDGQMRPMKETEESRSASSRN